MNWNRPNPLRGGGSSGVARVRRAAYSGPTMPEAKKKPHYHGHRLRLRERFRKAGADALADYELMEMVLFMANARGDVKPLAKTLIDRFGTFADAIAAPPERLAEVSGIGDASITSLKVIEAAALRLAQQRVLNRPTLSSWQALLDYCHASMAFEPLRRGFTALFQLVGLRRRARGGFWVAPG